MCLTLLSARQNATVSHCVCVCIGCAPGYHGCSGASVAIVYEIRLSRKTYQNMPIIIIIKIYLYMYIAYSRFISEFKTRTLCTSALLNPFSKMCSTDRIRVCLMLCYSIIALYMLICYVCSIFFVFICRRWLRCARGPTRQIAWAVTRHSYYYYLCFFFRRNLYILI